MKKQQLNHRPLFDRQFNLMYLLTEFPEPYQEDEKASAFWSKKTKSSTSKAHPPQNIMIHDIPKDMEFWYFQEGDLEEGEYIRSFFFEQYYSHRAAYIELEGYGGYTVVNNFDIPSRMVQDRLLVETYQPEQKIKRLWLGDKWGIDKVVRAELPEGSNWHYDVYNLMIRIIEKGEEGLLFQTLDF